MLGTKTGFAETAGSLGEEIRQGARSSVEIVRSHLDRIAAGNGPLNAIVVLDEEAALRRAEEADQAARRGEIWGPLHGVPVTVKEALAVSGLPTTANFKPLKDHVSDVDSGVVTRLRDAGAVIVGKTNVPMLLADYQTDGPVYGRANNPYDLARTPGGSSGGGAAAVAAGLTPLELGSDLGGSIRVPAHYCGLFALKPSENVVPLDGHVPPLPASKGSVHHMGTIGPLARSLADVELVFDIIRGPDHRDVNVAPIAWKPPSGRRLTEYTLAWSDTFGPFAAESDTVQLLSGLADRIGRAGASIAKRTPAGFDFEAAVEAWGQIFGYIMGEDTPLPIRTLLKVQWMTRRGPGARGIRKGLRIDFIDYARVLTVRKKLIAQLQAFFDQVDFWLCPVAMTPAFTHRRTGSPIDVDGVDAPYFTATGAFAGVFSLTGHPALVVPLGQSRDGLPIGLQIVGPYWSEPELLHFGKQLAELTPGFQPPA